MQTVVSSSDMRWCDETAIRSFGVPGILLMDRAGTSAAHVLLSRFAPLADRPVTVVCGSGNNAGDGFVVARVLANHGAHVAVVLCAPPDRLRGDAAAHFALLRREARTLGDRLTIESFRKYRTRSAARPALVVDALFGTGFTGTPRGPHAAAIVWMNIARAPVASLDIPSGIDATTGRAAGEAVHASTTVTFGLLKSGLLLNEGRDHAGHVLCVDIGIPRAVTNDKRLRTRLVESQDVAPLLPARTHRLHKYSAGKVLVIAGSRGYTGAASLATLGALRSGAGAVVLAHPEAVHSVLARKLTEPILLPLPSTGDGRFSPDAADALADRFEWADAVVIGPGLGRTQATAELLAKVLERYRGPTVIDADALTVLSELTIRPRSGRDWILTPHAGEFARLARTTAEDAENDRVGSVRAYARRTGWTTILKGSPTCTAVADGSVFINSTGNPGMATVGMGDVLAGLVGGLRSQGLSSTQAAWAGVYLHGRAGDLARERYGERSLLASDALEALPMALHEVEQRS